MARSLSKSAQDNRANQLNPAHPAYYLARGASSSEATQRASHSKAGLYNHANQLNPNSPTYWASRGETQPLSDEASNPTNESSVKSE